MNVDPKLLAHVERLEKKVVELADEIVQLRKLLAPVSAETPRAPAAPKRTIAMGAAESAPSRDLEGPSSGERITRAEPLRVPRPSAPRTSEVMAVSTDSSFPPPNDWAALPGAEPPSPASLNRVPLPRDAGRYATMVNDEAAAPPSTEKPSPRAKGSR
jgi:hypothetical protein